MPIDRAATPTRLCRLLAAASWVALALAASPLLAAGVPLQTLPPVASQPLLSAATYAELSFAARAGDTALIDAARRLMAVSPADAGAIAAAAIDLSPAIAADIAAAAAAAADDITITPAAGPLAVIGLGPLLAGAGGAAGVAVAAGAGGGGSSGAATPVAAPPDEPEEDPVGEDNDDPGEDDDPPPAPIDPTPFETPEYAAQPGLGVINAATAYARGLSGQGITVAMMDGPVDATDPELVGAVVSNAGTLPGPANAEATYAARIVAARRDDAGIHGVAPGATIYSSPKRGGDTAIAAAIRAAAVRSKVLHYGWIKQGPQITQFPADLKTVQMPQQIAAYRQVAAANTTVFVHATGDTPAGGRDNPNLHAGLPLFLPELAEVWIAVTAIGADGAITATANRCGVAALWCLAAPVAPVGPVAPVAGIDLPTTTRAAPHASGALALLIELFPELNASQIAERLLATANQTGIYADQAVYGHGLLDLAAATQPLGQLAFVAPAGATVPLTGSNIAPGPAFGDSFSRGLGAVPLAAADSQGAVFAVNAAPLVTQGPVAALLDDGFRRFAAPLTVTQTNLGAGLNMRFSPSGETTPPQVTANYIGATTQWRAALTSEHAVTQANPDIDLLTTPWQAPFRSLAPRRLELTVSVPSGHADIHLTSFIGSAPDQDAAFVGSETEAVWRTGGVVVGARFGSIVERDTVLGTTSDGAFAFAPGTPTTFAGISAQVGLPAGLRLNLSADFGLTFATPGVGSVISDLTPIRSQAFSAGISKPNVATSGDTLGLVARQPLRVESGSLSLPAYIAGDRSQVHRQAVSLSPSGRAVDVEAFYHRPVGHTGAFAASAVWRRHPGHDRTAPNEGVLSLRYRQTF